jgi:hypothetical protein
MILIGAALVVGAWSEYRAWKRILPELTERSAAITRKQEAYRSELIANRRVSEQSDAQQGQLYACIDAIKARLQKEGQDSWSRVNMDLDQSSADERLNDQLAEVAEAVFESLREPLSMRTAHLHADSVVDKFLRWFFRYCYRKGNAETALQVLAVTKRADRFQLLAKSLAKDFWNEDQLNRLNQSLVNDDGKFELDYWYQQYEPLDHLVLHITSRLYNDHTENPGLHWEWGLDAVHIERLMEAARRRQLPSPSSSPTREQVERSSLSVSIPQSNFSFRLTALRDQEMEQKQLSAVIEDLRRFLLTGIKVRQFKLSQGRWPNDLAELKSECTQSTLGHSFHYAVMPQQQSSVPNMAHADGSAPEEHAMVVLADRGSPIWSTLGQEHDPFRVTRFLLHVSNGEIPTILLK